MKKGVSGQIQEIEVQLVQPGLGAAGPFGAIAGTHLTGATLGVIHGA